MEIVFPVSIKKWNDIVNASPEATFFHTYVWAKILSESYGFEITTKLFLFGDGTEVLLPLMKTFTKLGVFRDFHSMPFSTYGGPVPSDIGEDKLRKVFGIFGATDLFSVIPSPLSSNKYWRGMDCSTFSTLILPLGEGFDFIWNRRFSSKVRNQCRKAEGEGYDISVDNSLEIFQWFSDTYSQAAISRGETPYPFSLYRSMHDNAGEQVKLWRAVKEGRVAGCLLALYGPKEVFYWSVAIEPKHVRLNLNNLLLKVVIEDACVRGYQYFNFGASSVGGRELETLSKYKESFGGDRIEYPICVREGCVYRISRTISRAVRIW